MLIMSEPCSSRNMRKSMPEGTGRRLVAQRMILPKCPRLRRRSVMWDLGFCTKTNHSPRSPVVFLNENLYQKLTTTMAVLQRNFHSYIPVGGHRFNIFVSFSNFYIVFFTPGLILTYILS